MDELQAARDALDLALKLGTTLQKRVDDAIEYANQNNEFIDLEVLDTLNVILQGK